MSEPLRLRERISAAATFLRERGFDRPSAGIILGSGLDPLAQQVKVEARVAFGDVPHFPVSTVAHHMGDLLYGQWAGRWVIVMNGRVHGYEGYALQEVTFPIRVMKALGIHSLIITSAAGGLNPLYREGELVAIVDHINLMGDNPLIGPNDDTLGPRFPDMSEPYDRSLIELATGAALREGIALHRGIFVAVAGPNLETRAEYRFLRSIGADLVGMSLVPEDLVAVHSGLRVLAVCVVTDMCLPDALRPANIDRILAAAAEAQPRLNRIIERVLSNLESAA